jgi:hypothetical protein
VVILRRDLSRVRGPADGPLASRTSSEAFSNLST